MNRWEPNPEWEPLPKPDVGDIVQLKLSDAFEYLVKAIVTSVAENSITATIDSLFDQQNKGWLTGGDKTNLVGKEISFSPRFMQNVIKKPTT